MEEYMGEMIARRIAMRLEASKAPESTTKWEKVIARQKSLWGDVFNAAALLFELRLPLTPNISDLA